MLERENDDGTNAKIKLLQEMVNEHDRKHHMETFSTKDHLKKRKLDDQNAGGADGGSGGVDATDCAELEAHGYEVEPQDVVDEYGFVMEKFCNMVRQPLSTYAPR
jgi:hypothetical protein